MDVADEKLKAAQQASMAVEEAADSLRDSVEGFLGKVAI